MSPAVRLCLCLLCLCACAAPKPPGVDAAGSDAPLAGRYLWVDTRCVDGAVPIAATGYAQTLTVAVRGGGFDLELDTAMPDRGCSDLSLWRATPASDAPPGAPLRIAPRANVVLPTAARCGPVQVHETFGSLQQRGDALDLTLRAAAFCRGLQAKIAYRRSAGSPGPDALLPIRRYLARFAAADPDGAAALFSERGALIESLSAHPDGMPTRHQGRPAVRRWLRQALSDRPWVALRVLDLQPLSEPGQYAARFEYMDPQLASPLQARNLFVIADGEIFETELQLLSLPQPRALDAGIASGPAAVTSPDAGD